MPTPLYAAILLLHPLGSGGACISSTRDRFVPPPQVDVRLVSDEADAALAILNARAAGVAPSPEQWARLFHSEGYRHLQERESAMRRPLTDSAFRAFLLSDTLLRRAPALRRALPLLERTKATDAANAALRYLPAETSMTARLYLEIKPLTNSFVFTGKDSTPSVFLYVDPTVSGAQLLNTLTHELHHIGLNAACPDLPPAHATPAQAMLLRFLGAFGEGQAMLAAAGSPSIHPHVADEDSVRRRWDADVARAPEHIADLSSFFTAVLNGRITTADSVQARAVTYYGTQGPWYTVGWLMASSIENELGRSKLIDSLCEPTRFIATYNEAAGQANRRGAITLPLWNENLVKGLVGLRYRRSDR